MPTHALHLDDSGTKDYATGSDAYKSGPTRYFVFGGVLTDLDSGAQLAQRLKDLKRETFGHLGPEVKSNWLRMPDERRKRYVEPLGISDEVLDRFVGRYYELVASSEVVLLAAVVDKVHMLEDYGPRAHYPPAVAYEVLMQRIQNELDGRGTCSVIVDDMTGKNPKGNEHKSNLMRHHKLLRQHGSRLQKGMHLDCLESLKFASSKANELVQVADLVAYNVYRQFRDHGEQWEDRTSERLPTYGYFARLARRFRRDSDGRIQGYGVIKFPLRQRIPWRIMQGVDK